jgi:hypothetical protein
MVYQRRQLRKAAACGDGPTGVNQPHQIDRPRWPLAAVARVSSIAISGEHLMPFSVPWTNKALKSSLTMWRAEWGVPI